MRISDRRSRSRRRPDDLQADVVALRNEVTELRAEAEENRCRLERLESMVRGAGAVLTTAGPPPTAENVVELATASGSP